MSPTIDFYDNQHCFQLKYLYAFREEYLVPKDISTGPA